MATTTDNRWRAAIGMSSDHAGIDRELAGLRNELYRVLAQVSDARAVRDYLKVLRRRSEAWALAFVELKTGK